MEISDNLCNYTSTYNMTMPVCLTILEHLVLPPPHLGAEMLMIRISAENCTHCACVPLHYYVNNITKIPLGAISLVSGDMQIHIISQRIRIRQSDTKS